MMELPNPYRPFHQEVYKRRSTILKSKVWFIVELLEDTPKSNQLIHTKTKNKQNKKKSYTGQYQFYEYIQLFPTEWKFLLILELSVDLEDQLK